MCFPKPTPVVSYAASDTSLLRTEATSGVSSSSSTGKGRIYQGVFFLISFLVSVAIF